MKVQTKPTPRPANLLCSGLLAIFAGLAWTAIQTKSPTVDEPYHVLANWLHLWQSDFRPDSQDPPLWGFWAALPNGPHSIRTDFDAHDWSALPMSISKEYTWDIDTLFRTPGNDAESFIRRSRLMMLIVAVALGAAIAAWTWHLARSLGSPPAISATISTILFCFDPNFLAHAAIVKNDVACSLAMLGVFAAVWNIGRRFTVPRVLAVSFLCGIALTVKFSGVLLVLIVIAVLIVRSMLQQPWRLPAYRKEKRITRFAIAAAILCIAAVISFSFIWLTYGLRFAPTHNPQSVMDLNPVARSIVERSWQLHHAVGKSYPIPTAQDLASTTPPLIVTAVQFANQHHLLPQAWLIGLLYTYQSSLIRGTFLCGQLSATGWWWYFPFAIAVKTPLATLAAIAISLFVFLRRLRTHFNFEILWTAIVLILPIAIYLAAAMSSNLNLGLRHVLPIYPFLFIVTGLSTGWLWQWKPKPIQWILPILLLGLIVESLAAYPNFIPFFNILAGGNRGGLRLLSDSNLDWGQDLKLLAQWQQQHPDEKLYLAYFGTADPAAYGIRYTNIPTGYWLGPPPESPSSPGVIAISATILQGPYLPRQKGQPSYAPLWNLEPIEILGGSIYLFRFPPQAQDQLPPGHRLIN